MIEYGQDYTQPENRLRLYTTAELADIPQKTNSVNGLVNQDSLTWIVGAPGSYKSFFAIDLALSVATGVQFYGRAVEQKPVVYVTGEGRAGLHNRVKAWKQGRQSEDRAFWHPEGIHALGEWWPRLVQSCVDVNAGMVVLDTQANMTAGMDENSAQEMGQWVRALQDLQRATQASVVTVHHPAKNAEGMRGSGIMNGAADSVFHLHRHSPDPLSPTRVTNPKQKDLAQADAWWIRPVPTAESMVLVECEAPIGA